MPIPNDAIEPSYTSTMSDEYEYYDEGTALIHQHTLSNILTFLCLAKYTKNTVIINPWIFGDSRKGWDSLDFHSIA